MTEPAPAPSAPTPTPASTPVVAPTSAPAPTDTTPDWLPERLARENEKARQAVLSELGVTDTAKAKAALQAAKDAEEASKSAAEKLGETSATLQTIKAEADRYKAVTTEFAARQMMGLTPEQQTAVKAIAGDDAAAQLAAITALAPTWLQAAAPPATPTTPTAPTPSTPSAGTTPPPNAPASDGNVSPPNHAATYEALNKANPFAAAQYLQEHLHSIYPEK